ncbi:MAG: ABC transporter permease [Synechococcales bacterium]|nr:ABC transporter permease [Synechococcales bacterium]
MQLDPKTQETLPVVIYTHESRLRRPGELFKEIWTDLRSSKELAWQLFYRKISMRYRQSFLGPLWAFIPPILVALTSTFLRESGVFEVGDTTIPYPIYVLFATILWQIFSRSLDMPLRAMGEGLALLRTVRVPVEGLLLAAIAELVFDQGIQILVLAAVFAIFHVPITWGVIPAVGALLLLIGFGMSLGLFLVPIGSLYTDIPSALPYLTRFWFFLTPILYPPPTDWPYSLLVELNPVTPLLLNVINLTTTGTMENVVTFTAISLLTVVAFVVGWVIYRVSVPLLVER